MNSRPTNTHAPLPVHSSLFHACSCMCVCVCAGDSVRVQVQNTYVKCTYGYNFRRESCSSNGIEIEYFQLQASASFEPPNGAPVLLLLRLPTLTISQLARLSQSNKLALNLFTLLFALHSRCVPLFLTQFFGFLCVFPRFKNLMKSPNCFCFCTQRDQFVKFTSN